MGGEGRKLTWDTEVDQRSKFLPKSKRSKNTFSSQDCSGIGRGGLKSRVVALSFTNISISNEANLNGCMSPKDTALHGTI